MSVTFVSGTTNAAGTIALLTFTGIAGHLFLGDDAGGAIGASGVGPGVDGTNVFSINFKKGGTGWAGGQGGTLLTPGGSKFTVSSPPSKVLAVNISALSIAFGDVIHVKFTVAGVSNGWLYDSADGTFSTYLDADFGGAFNVTIANAMPAPTSTALHVPNQIGSWLSAGD